MPQRPRRELREPFRAEDGRAGTVTGVNRKRLISISAIVSLWVVAFVVLDFSSRDNSTYQQVEPEVMSPRAPLPASFIAWKRESRYLYADNQARVGTDPVIYPGDTLPPRTEAIRVLVVGDSVTYGHGAHDLDMRWWRLLEEELDTRSGDGVFEIITMARNGASMYRYADWLTAETISTIDPDLIMLALNRNDVVPFGNEGMFCSDVSGETCNHFRYLQGYAPYQQCMNDADSLPATDRPAAFRSCERSSRATSPRELLDMNTLFQDPRKTMFAKEFDKATAMIRRGAGNTPLVIFPAFSSPVEVDGIAQLLDYFEDKGFMTVEAPLTTSLINKGDHASFNIHPYDAHPSRLVTRAISLDAVSAVYGHISAASLAEAERTVGKRPSPRLALVSNVLPVSLVVMGDDRSATIVATPGPRPLADDMQIVPCGDLMQPHTRIMLDPRLVAGTRITLRVNEASEPLDVHTVGYIDDKQVINEPTSVGKGESITITIGERGARGVLITPSSTPQGCSGAIDIPTGFTIALSR